MADMLPETKTPTPAMAGAAAIKTLLGEHKGGDVRLLDLREMNTWTDFFVIATATSNTHLDGLERHLKEFCHEQGITILRRSRKPSIKALSSKTSMLKRTQTLSAFSETQTQEDEWRIIDLGLIVIHLMSSRAREFYDLERLYSM